MGPRNRWHTWQQQTTVRDQNFYLIDLMPYEDYFVLGLVLRLSARLFLFESIMLFCLLSFFHTGNKQTAQVIVKGDFECTLVDFRDKKNVSHEVSTYCAYNCQLWFASCKCFVSTLSDSSWSSICFYVDIIVCAATGTPRSIGGSSVNLRNVG